MGHKSESQPVFPPFLPAMSPDFSPQSTSLGPGTEGRNIAPSTSAQGLAASWAMHHPILELGLRGAGFCIELVDCARLPELGW